MIIDNFILIGGHRMLVDLSKIILNKSYKLDLIIDKFHLGMMIDEKTTLKKSLEDENIKYNVISSDRLTVKDLKKYVNKNTIGVSISSPWILSRKIIDLFNGRLLNIHTSNLPKNKGGGGYSWQIMMNDMSGGICIHKVDEGIDSGDIVLSYKFTYPNTCNIPSDFNNYLEPFEQKIIREFMNKIGEWSEFPSIKQKQYEAEYWPRLNTKVHGYIDWSWNGDQIKYFIDAFDDPYVGAATFINGHEVHVKKCEKILNKNYIHPFQSGIIYKRTKSKIYIAGLKYSLIIKFVENFKGISYIDKIRLGDRFYTPYEYIEKSFSKRVFYKADSDSS